MNENIIIKNETPGDVLPGVSFKVVFLQKGVLDAVLNGFATTIPAPALICLNSEDKALFDGPAETCAILHFSPSDINSSFSPENLKSKDSQADRSAVLDLYYLRSFLERSSALPEIIKLGPQSETVMREKFARLTQECSDSAAPLWPCRKRSALIELLMQITVNFDQKGPLQNFSQTDELTKKIIFYIETNYPSKITISEICGRFSTNRNTLSKQFKSSTGYTFIEYLTRTRTQMACVLLRETSLPASDILYRVGFNDAAHFARAFRKYTGQTPTAYRADKKQHHSRISAESIFLTSE